MEAEAVINSHVQHENRKAKWKQIIKQEKKHISSASKSFKFSKATSGNCAPAPPKSLITAGMDHNSEVPPINKHKWCSRCTLVKVYFYDEEVRICNAEDEVEEQGKCIYHQSMSHNDQHKPMVVDVFITFSSN